jgi:hypothetical protein
MSNFKILNIFLVSGHHQVTKNTLRFVLRRNLLNKTQDLTFLSRNLYGRYPKDSKFQSSENEVFQNFSFLAFIGTEL